MPVLKQKVLQAFFRAALRWDLWFPRRCAQIILCGITAARHVITRSTFASAVLGSGVAVVPSRGIRSPLLSELGSLSMPTAVRHTCPIHGQRLVSRWRLCWRWTACRLSLSVRLDPPRCHLTPRRAALPVGPQRAAAGSLACSCRAECPVTQHGLRQFSVPRLAAASQSPTRVPAATDSLSAMEALRLGPLAVHDDVTEEICTVPLSLADRGRAVGSTFSHDSAESHAT
ncbi:hypothetical protein TcYC6_0006670 [Trypanosoma cruzi]|nr:hypothetical protein TcYC6_0006670 [Trypanosoma cruzi]